MAGIDVVLVIGLCLICAGIGYVIGHDIVP